MKLWILRPREDAPHNPWDPWYDKAFGFVVCAEDEASARECAHSNGGAESSTDPDEAPWKDPRCSTCIELTPGDVPHVIMCDLRSA